MDGPTLVDIVERELVARHIKKAEFYAATKISSATFSQWRNNIYFPSAANIKTIEEYLGISISYSVADKAAKKERPTDGEALISELPEDIQKLIRICESNPDLLLLYYLLRSRSKKVKLLGSKFRNCNNQFLYRRHPLCPPFALI